MTQFLLDLVPVLLFFLAFKLYGIYVATLVGIIATAIQVLLTFAWKKRFDRQQLLTLVVFVIFGGLTLYFHNPLFVKWKPTVIFWVMGIVFFLSRYIGKKTIAQRMFEKGLEGVTLTDHIWQKLNGMWAGFFLILGAINIIIAYHFSTDAWVNFKLYGITSLLLLFCIFQAIFLSRYMADSQK